MNNPIIPRLIKAELVDYPIVKNLAQLYVYDMSKSCGWPCDDKGIIKCTSFKNYFNSDTCFPFLIKTGEELTGFVLVNKQGSDELVEWNIGEFFILGKFQRTGIGITIAHEIYDKFKGEWETAVMPENSNALHFWRNTIGKYINSNFTECQKAVLKPCPHPMIIFRFNNSKIN